MMEVRQALEELEGTRLELNQVAQLPRLRIFARSQVRLLTGAMKTADDAANELEKSSSR